MILLHLRMRILPGCEISEMQHLWIVGMMGAGKTTVGVLVAQILDLPFIDTDAEIMVETGRTITEIFEEGETVFRQIESEVLVQVASREPSVIGTGGGVIISPHNVAVMQGSGTVLLLDVDVPTIIERVGLDPTRPLLSSVEALEELHGARNEIYHAVADLVFSTPGREPTEIAGEVAACFDM